MAAEIVLLDHLAHVGQDLGRGRDRRAGPRLEPVAERIKVAVRPDAGECVRNPGPPETLPRLQYHEARSWALLRQMIRAADPGNAGADDEDVEVFGRRGGDRSVESDGIGHGANLPWWPAVVSGERHDGVYRPVSRLVSAALIEIKRGTYIWHGSCPGGFAQGGFAQGGFAQGGFAQGGTDRPAPPVGRFTKLPAFGVHARTCSYRVMRGKNDRTSSRRNRFVW